MAYICRLQPRPGTLILEKCVEYGVPPGPLLGKLKSGEDITLPSGVLVKAADVREPNDPGPVFIGICSIFFFCFFITLVTFNLFCCKWVQLFVQLQLL